MFIKINKKTGQEETITSEEMVSVLEADLRQNDDVDEVLTEIVTGVYEHSNATATYKYRA